MMREAPVTGHVSIVQLYHRLSVATVHVLACRAEEIKAAAWCICGELVHEKRDDTYAGKRWIATHSTTEH